ncbi:MAG: flagellar basal body rod protein FlgC [Phycisphaerales bacterium]|nr:flagellar basal body rod protein FlgC [Phycisphaerales bacterium]
MLFGALDISSSGLVAQRQRLTAIAGNIANIETLVNAEGEYAPYQRRIPVFATGDPATGSGQGVHLSDIMLDESPLQMRYEPDSPWANEQGYVGYPDISLVIEQMNAMEASRAYEANITVAEATKSMYSIALEILT